MDMVIAEKRAREFLADKIDLIRHETKPDNHGFYNVDLDRDTLFSFRLSGKSSLDDEQYIAVSKETGEVRLV